MKVTEEDTTVDYRIEFSSLDQAVKEQFCECYNLAHEKSEGATNIILSHNNEV